MLYIYLLHAQTTFLGVGGIDSGGGVKGMNINEAGV